jgi:hypothetical protein
MMVPWKRLHQSGLPLSVQGTGIENVGARFAIASQPQYQAPLFHSEGDARANFSLITD